MKNYTAVDRAAYGGYYKVVKLLLDHGAEINFPDSSHNALHSACEASERWVRDLSHMTGDKNYEETNRAVIDLLIRAGADANARDEGRWGAEWSLGSTPLINTIMNQKNLKMACYLASHPEVDVNVPNDEWTALDVATPELMRCCGDPQKSAELKELIRILKSRGAKHADDLPTSARYPANTGRTIR